MRPLPMETSRRSSAALDRSSEPRPKKPKLVPNDSPYAAPSRDRQSPPPQRPGAAQASNPRGRPPPPPQQQQELVAQYKTALSELTFNSKPIITNLTIIAGENLRAAKAIAAVICTNVLEVPIEQKLSSLYLLDSIVKNIGGDYIKHFAAKLPEVFCNAYRQVDASIHPSMRHLFGTWKGLFPSSALQMIDKELGFQMIANGSSTATILRPDSKSQRPSHSIHVNPKYLEARRSLQQPHRNQGANNDGALVTFEDAADTTDKAATEKSSVRWTDVPNIKPAVQRPQKDPVNNSVHEERDIGDVRWPDLSDVSQQQDRGVGRVNERLRERDRLNGPYYGAGVGTPDMQISRGNSPDVKKDFQAPGSTRYDNQLSSTRLNNSDRNSRLSSESWKNSEEEEYLWDDVNYLATDFGGVNSLTKGESNVEEMDKLAGMQHGKWKPPNITMLESHLNLNKIEGFSRFGNMSGRDARIPPFTDLEENPPHLQTKHDASSRIGGGILSEVQHDLGPQSSKWLPNEKPLSDIALDHKKPRFSNQSEEGHGRLLAGITSSSTISVLLSHAAVSSLGTLVNSISRPSEMIGQQRQHYWQSAQSTVHSPPSSEPDHFRSSSVTKLGQMPLKLQDQLKKSAQPPLPLNSFSISAQNNSQELPGRFDPQLGEQLKQGAQMPLPLDSFSASAQNNCGQLPSRFDLQVQPQPFQHVQEPSSISSSEQIMQSKGHPRTAAFFQPSTQLPLPVGPATQDISVKGDSKNSTTHTTGQTSISTNLLAAIVNSGLTSNESVCDIQNLHMQPPLPSGPSLIPLHIPSCSVPAPRPHLTNEMLPPLPSGLRSSSSFLHATSQTSETADPIAGLLSSLVAKGLISSPATEVPATVSSQSSSTAEIVQSASSAVVHSSSVKESASEPAVPLDAPSQQSTSVEILGLIGFEFNSEILRECHPSVISCLFDRLNKQCRICGMRFKLGEELDAHLEWHAVRKSEMNNNRKWYPHASHWIAGSVGLQSGKIESIASLMDEVPVEEQCEWMVPVDESQIICALCGEPFEDIYSDERDEWMYKDTVYWDLLTTEGGFDGVSESRGQMTIVHAKCISRT